MPPNALRLLDTTLRDGTGGADFQPGSARRAEIARSLAEAGLDVLELFAVGDPDLETASELAAALRGVRVCVLARATAGELEEALRVLDGADERRIHLYADLTRREGVAEALEGIWAARTNLDEVEFSPLRAFETTTSELLEHALAATDSGATIINLSDTTGQSSPERVGATVAALRDRLDTNVTLSFHGHDDRGRAVENAVAACRSGAAQVHVCIDAVGPRGGNTSTRAFIDALAGDDSLAPRAPRLDPLALSRAEALVRKNRG